MGWRRDPKRFWQSKVSMTIAARCAALHIVINYLWIAKIEACNIPVATLHFFIYSALSEIESFVQNNFLKGQPRWFKIKFFEG